MQSRGYFGIGVEGVSKSANVGALLRTAHAFGAAFCFTVAPSFDARAARLADTSDTAKHVPLWRFDDAEAMTLPKGCVLVGIEITEEAALLLYAGIASAQGLAEASHHQLLVQLGRLERSLTGMALPRVDGITLQRWIRQARQAGTRPPN
jgi:hypothetical protein